MFKEFFVQELKMALKQPMVYVFMLLFTILTFAAVASESVVIGGTIGVIKKNAPHVITIYTTILSIFGLLMATAFFNNAALRDYNHQFNEILFSTPLSKSGYFLGRFLGALILSTIPLLGVFLGIILGTYIGPAAGWIAEDRFGPMYFESFVNNYLLFVIPNMLFAGSVIFAMANKWKSTTISFVGTLLIIIGYIVSGTLMSDIENETIAALLDPFGIRSYSIVTKYYTPLEKNTLSPAFGGILLMNRLLWLGVGFGILVLSYFSFSFKEKSKKAKKPEAQEKETIMVSRPTVAPIYPKGFNWTMFVSFFTVNLLSILKSTTFRILFLFAGVILVTNITGGFEYYGLQSFPVTYKMIDMIGNSGSLFMIIILVFFSGELIWRDRDSHINEVIDATPHVSFVSLISKTLSLVSITVILHVFFVLIGIIYQLGTGYSRLELGLYFTDFILKNLPNYFVWSTIFIFLQVIINQKYIAYFASILLLFVLDILMLILDVQSNMIDIAGRPSLTYSELNGFGPGLKGALWFNSYWALFGVILILLSGLLWNRGVRSGIKSRLALLRSGYTGMYGISTSVVIGLWVVVASFVFYNTQVLNTYETSDSMEQLLVDYENKYSKYSDVKPPKITDVKYHIDIFPSTRSATVKAVLKVTNSYQDPIDSVHFSLDKDWNQVVNLPNSEQVFYDEDLDYQILKLNTPLKQGDTIEMEILASYVPKGFENDEGNTTVVENGTFFNNMSVLPSFGYNERAEIRDVNKRKKFGLKIKDRMAKLTSDCGDQCMVNYLSTGSADWVNVETFISTSEDQIAIAPGSKISEEVKDGRRQYHYKVDHPSQNFYAFMSARYEVATRKWKDVDLEVYYDKDHDYNIEMMLDAVQRSLEYYTKNFGPYYHKQARIIEFPRYSTFAQAFPGTMPYSESFGFITDLEGEENNVIDAVIAHEMAHQWWAHQEVSAAVQGATMLTESFAEYSSLMVMKGISDPMKMTEFLKYDYDRYLRGRSRERIAENPLYKVENQSYIHYGKGSVIMYALQEYIGEEKVNAVLKEFLDSTKYRSPPYPTTLDFLSILEPQVPDSLKHVIDDWFKEITLYDLRLKEATYEKLAEDKYRVTVNFEANKLYADSLGNEIKQDLNEWIDVGALAENDEDELLAVSRIKVQNQNMTHVFETSSKPGKIVIDPKRLLVERVIKDNSKRAKESQ